MAFIFEEAHQRGCVVAKKVGASKKLLILMSEADLSLCALSWDRAIKTAGEINKGREARQVFHTIAQSKLAGVYLRRSIANSREVFKKTLALLAKDKDSSVREYVAQNPNTPRAVLKILAKSKGWVSPAAVAQNVIIARFSDILSDLIGNKYVSVRKTLAYRRDLTTETYFRLSGDQSFEVRWELARNPRRPGEIRAVLLRDKEKIVREAAQNPPLSYKAA